MNKRASSLFESLEYTIGISGTQTVIDGYYVDADGFHCNTCLFIKYEGYCNNCLLMK